MYFIKKDFFNKNDKKENNDIAIALVVIFVFSVFVYNLMFKTNTKEKIEEVLVENQEEEKSKLATKNTKTEKEVTTSWFFNRKKIRAEDAHEMSKDSAVVVSDVVGDELDVIKSEAETRTSETEALDFSNTDIDENTISKEEAIEYEEDISDTEINEGVTKEQEEASNEVLSEEKIVQTEDEEEVNSEITKSEEEVIAPAISSSNVNTESFDCVVIVGAFQEESNKTLIIDKLKSLGYPYKEGLLRSDLNYEIKLYGADWCPDCRRAKTFLTENNIDFNFIDVDLDQEATQKVETINNGKRIIPTFIIDGKSYTNPDNQKLASVLGINEVGKVQLFGADWCPDCRRAKNFLRDNAINFEFIDVDKHDWATDKVEEINNGKRIIPTILIDNKPHTNPDNITLTDLLSINIEKEHKIYDTIIIGGGAAGLTTSIYAQRDRFDTLILEKTNIGGNAFLTGKIENYPGFTSISGPKLMDKMEQQAKTYGADIKTGEEVTNIAKENGLFIVKTKSTSFIGKTIVISTGSTYRLLGIPNESELIGSGIHFCATCDGAFYRDKDIIVVGGGNSALEEGIFLAGFCKSVKIVHRSAEFSASDTYVEKLKSIDNISTYMNKTSVEFIAGENELFKSLKVKDNKTEEEELISADGVFIFIGLIPNTKPFKDLVDVNEKGFIKTFGLAETNIKGVFAAGDCREGAIAQVAAATGEGVLASYGIRSFLK